MGDNEPVQHNPERAANESGAPALLGALSKFLCGLAVLGLALVAGLLAWQAPQFERILEEFDTEMPALSALVHGPGRLISMTVAGALALAMLGKEFLLQHTGVKLAVNAVMLLATILWWGVVILTLYLPLIRLISSLGNG